MKIAILLSTYNGEQFIKKQLDSIFNQKDVEFELFIRDDCSTDETVSIINEYKNMYNDKIHFVIGKRNIGALRSYEWLIRKAPDGYDYYSFADQDDIWYEDKLSAAINKLRTFNSERPNLYICNQNCVDKDCNFMYKRFPDEFIQPCIMDTILNNQYSGCTMVLNNSLMKNVKLTYRVSGKSLRDLYDVWVLTVAQATGNVFFDKEPYIDFRRHDGNVTQASFGKNLQLNDVIKRFKKMFKTVYNYSYYKGYTSFRAQLLIKCFEQKMDPKDVVLVKELATYNDSLFRWIRTVTINPLWEYYQPPKIITWIRFLVNIY